MAVGTTAVNFRSQLLLLYAARGVRGFGDGFAVIILPAYLTAIGFTPVEIGFVATAALLGSSLLTLTVGFVAPRHDLRSMLMIGAGLMVATGLVFPQVEHIAFVMLVAFFGTINPQSGDAGVLVPLEHAMLARGVAAAERTRAFARYSLTGALATAAGSLAAATPDLLVTMGFGRIASFQAMFYAYAALGLVGAALYRRSAARAGGRPRHQHAARAVARHRLQARRAVQPRLVCRRAAWCSRCWRCGCSSASTCRSRRRRLFFFWTGVFTAFSYPVAVWLAKRIGLINTMVFTHIPSSLLLILAAFATNLYVALGLLLIRAALSQMDVPTRSSYVMAVVTPAERTAAASATAVPRSLASSLGPAFAGALLATPFSGLPLIMCGVLKITYDLALLYTFRHVKPPEEL